MAHLNEDKSASSKEKGDKVDSQTAWRQLTIAQNASALRNEDDDDACRSDGRNETTNTAHFADLVSHEESSSAVVAGQLPPANINFNSNIVSLNCSKLVLS